jgi:hypothetical protein
MNDGEQQRFVEAVKRQLDTQSEALDELTLARLRAARKRALEAGTGRRRYWLPALGTATAAVLALAFLLWPASRELPVTLDDWEIVASQDDLELIEEYDFYEWLEATQDAG